MSSSQGRDRIDDIPQTAVLHVHDGNSARDKMVPRGQTRAFPSFAVIRWCFGSMQYRSVRQSHSARSCESGTTMNETRKPRSIDHFVSVDYSNTDGNDRVLFGLVARE